MQHSTRRILTTHAGSLPRPADLLEMLAAKEQGQPVDDAARAARLPQAVKEIVRKQIELGIDVIDDGEYSKPSFVTYVNERLGGFEVDGEASQRGPWAGSREALSFPEFYAQLHVASRQNRMVCTDPITYKGHAQLQRDIAHLKAAIGSAKVEAFVPAISPSNVEEWQRNAYYKTQEEYVFAIGEAMREEYRAIVDAGFLLQIDDPRLVSYYLVRPDASIAECRKWANLRVEALNHALRGIPPEKVRHHTCYGINMGPRVHDMEVKHLLDIILKINAGAYSFEAANPRHEHEWKILGEREAAEGQGADPGRDQPLDRAGRASRARGRADRAVRADGGKGAGDRRLRLRLCDVRRIEGGSSVDRVGEAHSDGRWRAARKQGALEARQGGEEASGQGRPPAGGEAPCETEIEGQLLTSRHQGSHGLDACGKR